MSREIQISYRKMADSGSWSKFFQGVGGFLKILRNCQSGSWQMLTSNYKVGGWGEKKPKTLLEWSLSNLKKPICASKRDMLGLAILR